MQEVNIIGKKKNVAVKTRMLLPLDGNAVDLAGGTTTPVGVSYPGPYKFGMKAAAFAAGGSIAVTKTAKHVIQGDLTIELFLTLPAISGAIENLLFSMGNAGIFLDFLSGYGTFNSAKPCILASLSVNNDKSSIVVADWSFADNLPHHLAMCRKNNVMTVYADGVSKGSIASTAEWNGTGPVIGNYYVSGAYASTKGLIQQVRLSDFCRYTAPFTPPAAPFVLD